MMRMLAVPAVAIALSACAANLQALPVAVGEQDNKAVWLIHGYTDPGETAKADAQRYADRYSVAHCRSGKPQLLSLETEPASSGLGKFLRWNARFVCA